MNKKVVLFLLLLIFQSVCSAQINVFEKPPEKDVQNPGIFQKSSTRQIIDLNGKWNVSIDNGASYSTFIVPMIMDFKSKLIYKRNFQLTDDMLTNYSFILVCEGLGYESEIFINNNFVTKNSFGYLPTIIQLDENSLNTSNEIQIITNNKLKFNSSLPSSIQTDIPKIYTGIQGDVYLMAVPKLFVFDAKPTCRFESETSGRVMSYITISTGNIKKYKDEGKNFSIKSVIYKGTNFSETIAESNSLKFNIEDYQSVNLKQDFSVKSPSQWSPESPELYTFKIQVYNSDNLVDEFYTETGFTNIKFSLSKKSYVDLKGNVIKINGVNYFCDYPNFGTAIPYKLIEKDIRNIKDIGFNAIRVQGVPASPYLINICNRIGVYVLEEIPFNQISNAQLKRTELLQSAYEYLENLIKKDMSAPCVIGWGIGNDFDVTTTNGQSYVLRCRETSSKLDYRPIYYTTNNFTGDICSDLVDFRGINLRNVSLEKLEKTYQEIKSLASAKTPAFISNYGVTINNDNKNGFNDKTSVDYQTKYLSEGYTTFSKSFFANFILSYADWYESRPLNYYFAASPYLNTSGLFDYNRNTKSSALFMKKVLNFQSLQKLTEGKSRTFFSDKSFIPVLLGLVLVLLFSFFYTRLPRFKEGVTKSYSMSFKSGNFYVYGKEQNLFSPLNSFLVLIFSVSGIALYVSSIFYFFRENFYWDVFISNIFDSDNLKITFDSYASNPLSAFMFIFALTIVHISIISILITIISLLVKQRISFKNIFTIVVWALYPFLLLLPIGSIMFNLATLNSHYVILSLLLFLFFWILYVFRLVSGFKYLFDYNLFKSILYGCILLVITFGGTIVYLTYFSTVFSTISLILSYK